MALYKSIYLLTYLLINRLQAISSTCLLARLEHVRVNMHMAVTHRSESDSSDNRNSPALFHVLNTDLV